MRFKKLSISIQVENGEARKPGPRHVSRGHILNHYTILPPLSFLTLPASNIVLFPSILLLNVGKHISEQNISFVKFF